MVQSLATLPLKRRRSLGFVLVLPVPEDQAKRKRELGQSPKELSREIARRNCSRTLRFNWFCLLCYCWIESVWRKQRQFSKRFPPRKRSLRTLLVTLADNNHDKTLLWTQGREEKNWYKKVKEEGRTCQELLRCWKKAVFWQEKKETYLQKPKKSKLKRPKPKINCSPP